VIGDLEADFQTENKSSERFAIPLFKRRRSRHAVERRVDLDRIEHPRIEEEHLCPFCTGRVENIVAAGRRYSVVVAPALTADPKMYVPKTHRTSHYYKPRTVFGPAICIHFNFSNLRLIIAPKHMPGDR